jgi:hypothetical protein
MSLSETFDLKGLDTGKIGGNKGVDLTFKEYQKKYGLTDKGTKRDLEARGYFLDDLNPIITTQDKTENFLRDFAPAITPLGVVSSAVNQLKGNEPIDASDLEVVGGRLVAKDRPMGLRGGIASLVDAGTFGATDFDKMGGGPLQGLLTGSQQSMQGYGQKFTGDYELPKLLKEQLKGDQDEGSKDPLDNIKNIYKAQMEYEREMDPFKRKGRALDSAMEFANLRTQMPFYMNQLKDLTTFKQRQLLDAEKIKQGLPNAQQARLLAADQGFAQQAGAIAGQQDAATRFAGLGMQRGFGQLS